MCRGLPCVPKPARVAQLLPVTRVYPDAPAPMSPRRPGAVFGLDDAMLADPLLRQQTPILGTGDAQMPYVWVEDVARGHVLAVRTVLDGRGAQVSKQGRGVQPVQLSGENDWRYCLGPQMDLKAFHLTGDPRGTRYGTFCGDAPRGPDGLTIWGGKRDVPRIPMTLARALAAVNEAWAASFGYAPLDRNLTTAAIIYTQTTYTYDVSGATNGDKQRMGGSEWTRAMAA